MSGRHVGLLLGLAGIWGGSYLLIKLALEDFEPAFVVWLRLLVALVVLAVAMGFGGRREDLRVALADLKRRPGRAALLGLLAIAAPFMLITVGELHVASGLTAVLIAPASIFVAILAPLFDQSERADARAALGMVIGLAGVALVVGVETVQSTQELLGALAILGAALFYALSGFVVKGSYAHMSSLATSFTSIAASSVLIAPFAVVSAPDRAPGAKSLLALLALGAIGTALAFVIFYKLIAEIGAGRASLVSYLAPGVALLYGALLLHESITLAAVAGLFLILFGVTLASGSGSKAALRKA
ncbi:MAG: DMT family transporter [Actinomycetota bacterium]|nr:DMT family transporter [Actinomycetota bacterium]